MSTKFTASVGLDIATIVAAALAVGVGSMLYAIASGWVSL